MGCTVGLSTIRQPTILLGRVVSDKGIPLGSVQLTAADRTTRSRPDGTFQLQLPPHPVWLAAKSRGYLSSLRPAQAGDPIVVRLSPDDGATVVIHAGGDVMAGRRFFESDAKAPGRPLLPNVHSRNAHHQLLEPIRPLLQQADLTVLNLETPLLNAPIAEQGGQRTLQFHPSKNLVFASSPELAAALRQAGVDVLGIANNHLYDALEVGLQSTLKGLTKAGFAEGSGRFGAGVNPHEAWQPAVQTLRGQKVTLLGCTTVHGTQQAISYVASASQHKGGATLCEADRLTAAVKSAQKSGSVVVMIHGGNEYQVRPTPAVERMINVARSAGATLILNHHPHVLGGLRWDGGSLVATSLGNFLFDQTHWATFPSLLLEIHLRHGVVTRVTGFPLLIHGYRPHAAVGELASWVLRSVMAREPGPWILEAGVLESDFGSRQKTAMKSVPLHADPKRGGLWHIPPGVGLCGHNVNGTLELGHDLLGVGGFEDELVAALPRAGALWNLSGTDKQVIPEAAHRGRLGVRLHRSGFNRQSVLLTPLHRLPVTPGQRLTFLSWIRGSAGAKARLQLSWYAARRGASQARLEHRISSLAADRWQPIHWDVKVPDHTVALGVFLALDPGGAGRHHMDVDDVALIHWQPSDQPRQSQDWLRLRGRGKLCLQRSALPGGSQIPISLQRFG